MMNPEALEVFNRITNKSLKELTKHDIAFLKARRSYLNPAQRMAYEELKLFALDEVKESVKE